MKRIYYPFRVAAVRGKKDAKNIVWPDPRRIRNIKKLHPRVRNLNKLPRRVRNVKKPAPQG